MKVDKLIVESSVIVISIFSTVGLLIGASSQQFKSIYIYFGYMLYFSFPFIFATMTAIISMIAEYRFVKTLMSYLSIGFFLTGFVFLFSLACLATQTASLPGSFMYVPIPQDLLVWEISLAVLFASGLLIGNSVKHVPRTRPLFGLGLVLLFGSALFMGALGIQQTKVSIDANSIFLKGSPNYEFTYKNFSLKAADQISISIDSANKTFRDFAFMNEQNYWFFQNASTRPQAQTIEEKYVAENFSFLVVINSNGRYFLAMKSDYSLGINITYEVNAFRIDNSNMSYAIIPMATGVFIILLVAGHKDKKKTASFFVI